MNELKDAFFTFIAVAVLTATVTSTVATSNTAASTAAPVAKRMHHYVFFGMDREKIKDAKSFLDTPAFEGAQVAYTWRQLEPQKDQYDFSLIKEDLSFLRAHGKKLWIQFQDVTFNPKRINVPEYLLDDPKYNGGAVRQYQVPDGDDSKAVHEGWMARRWDPAVQERLHKLFAELGKAFDGQIEGINLAETSGGFGSSGKLFPPAFSKAIYREGIIVNIKALKRSFQKSIAMVYANFMPGGRHDLDLVYKAARESKVAVGGPDLMPFRPFQRVNSYPLIRESSGKVPTGVAVQDGNYGDLNLETGKRATIADLITFAIDYLKLDYVFWCTEEPYYSRELIPFFRDRKPNHPQITQIKNSAR